MGQISIARGVVAVDPTSGPGLPIYSDVTSPYVLYSGVGGLISGSSAFQWDNTNSTLKLGTGAEFDLYNTADQTTNYERLRVESSSNVFYIRSQIGGSGTPRQLWVGVQASGSSFTYRSGVGDALQGIYTVTAQGTNLVQTSFSLQPNISQSGTAGYTALDINPTETATGSGTKLLQRWAVGGALVSSLTRDGLLYVTNFVTGSTLSWGSSTTALGDVQLARDAADTLALRRLTNAQTFRVYNTYTDASNYERGFFGFVSNNLWLGMQNAGTGSYRELTLAGGGIRFRPLSGGGDAWQFNSSGHFLAVADNTYDIGASGANRPRNVYIGGSTVIGAFHTVGVSTVATLPAAAGAARAQIFVSDSSVAAAGNFGAIVAGGGANIVPVFSDGTNWRIG